VGQVQGVKQLPGRLKVLEDENRQLKKLVADKELIIQTFTGREAEIRQRSG